VGTPATQARGQTRRTQAGADAPKATKALADTPADRWVLGSRIRPNAQREQPLWGCDSSVTNQKREHK
jgi:hypothetical protein